MKSLKKALRVLEIFLDIGLVEVRLSELAKMSGLNIATVNRIVSVFVELGYLSQMERRGRYTLGTKFLRYSALIKQRNMIRDISLPYAIKLSRLVEESVVILSWDGSRLVLIDEVQAKHPLRITKDPGLDIPLYCTGVGKVILANMKEQELHDYFCNNEMTGLTRNTITMPDNMRIELKRIAQEGVAYDCEERYPGVNNLSAPLRDAEDSLVGCIGILGSSVRLTREKMTEIVPDLKKCALQVSMDLGYKYIDSIPS